MNVILQAKPNNDFPKGSHEATIDIPAFYMPCVSFEDASQICRSFIRDANLGSGNWSGGEIVDDNGQAIGYVAYNGRVIKK